MHIDDLSSDDNGQDLTNYNFAADGFTTQCSTVGLVLPNSARGGVDWMRKMAFRYRRIKELYNAHKAAVEALLGDRSADWQRIRSEYERETDFWCSTAQKCLSTINSR